MLPVGSKPILEHIVDWLKGNDLTEIVIATGYLGRMIEDYFRDGRDFGVSIEYARSDRPLGHAGQLKSAQPLLGKTFVCLYGDAILDFDLRKLLAFHRERHALVTMAIMEYQTQMKYGVIETERDGRVRLWKEKPIVKGNINVGCYAMEKRFLDYIPEGKVYGMKEAFDEALKEKEAAYALLVKGTFTDIGDRKAYREADSLYIERYGKIP
jgi:mannose-1-phosphate guanylyltransferase